MEIYNHNSDTTCNFSDFMGPFGMVLFFIVLLGANIIYFVGLVECLLAHETILNTIKILCPLLIFSFFLTMFIKEGGGLYPFKLFFEHILYFSISDSEIQIKYTKNGLNRKYLNLNKENISKFHINYFDIRQSYHGTITCITANIKIDTFDGNHFEIKSTGTIIGLVKFLSQNCNKIPNYSCHTDSEAMEKYLNLIQKK